MKIAVPFSVDYNAVFQHFGHCENFKIYTFAEDGVTVFGKVDAAVADKARYVLPIVKDSASVEICAGTLASKQPIFNLNPGFICTEYTVSPNEKGEFSVKITV